MGLFRKESVLKTAEEHRKCAEEHRVAAKAMLVTFLRTGVIMAAALIVILAITIAWFASNSQVEGTSATISVAGQIDFALATVGTKSQSVFDSIFHLSDSLAVENIGGIDYYIASGNSSFRVSSDKNLNNYLANADLRPGNRGSFDLYVICRTDNRNLVLNPIFSAWNVPENDPDQHIDAFSAEGEVRKAAELLKGHILLFAHMDEKGMYSGNIDLTKVIKVDLINQRATQSVETEGASGFSWGEKVYPDADVYLEDNTAVYRLPIYWVWPEQFGNLIYTGNSYNKNLFADKKSADYSSFISAMESAEEYKKFFYIEIPGEVNRPPISTITSPEDYKTATENYELYSGWYNAADGLIGDRISYIELGFEIAQGSS